MPRRYAAAWRLCLPLLCVLPLAACLVVVSTAPSSTARATIVFVAVDDGGALVASLRVTVVGIDSSWREEGLTASDGIFHCTVGAGVTRVRAAVAPPSGYVLAGQGRWPREIDVDGGTLQIEVRVTRAMQTARGSAHEVGS